MCGSGPGGAGQRCRAIDRNSEEYSTIPGQCKKLIVVRGDRVSRELQKRKPTHVESGLFCMHGGVSAKYIAGLKEDTYPPARPSIPANWNPPAPAGAGMRNSREVAFLKGATGSCRWGLHSPKNLIFVTPAEVLRSVVWSLSKISGREL
jgi:hypothetical protein